MSGNEKLIYMNFHPQSNSIYSVPENFQSLALNPSCSSLFWSFGLLWNQCLLVFYSIPSLGHGNSQLDQTRVWKIWSLLLWGLGRECGMWTFKCSLPKATLKSDNCLAYWTLTVCTACLMLTLPSAHQTVLFALGFVFCCFLLFETWFLMHIQCVDQACLNLTETYMPLPPKCCN